MKTFRTLDLAVEFYDLVQAMDVSGNLRDQLHRAASSISLNLSEGNAKGSVNEKRHFFQTAYGSLRECQTVFRLLKIKNHERPINWVQLCIDSLTQISSHFGSRYLMSDIGYQISVKICGANFYFGPILTLRN